ncbi:hypothetical protein MRX96_049122, partial [Rhipicephalus microplus]
MEVRVQGTDMDPSQYDPRDWTQVLRVQANLRETRNASHGTNADPSVRETPSQSRETPQTATTPGLQSSSTQLRVLHTTAQRSRDYRPFHPTDLRWCSAPRGGVDLTTLQPRYLLTALMQAAALTDPSTLTLLIHPVNNTCTVSAEGVDHSLRGASTKRSEPHAGQRKGQTKSSNQPTWADKLKTPNGTRPPATNTPSAPDPCYQELRALRVE